MSGSSELTPKEIAAQLQQASATGLFSAISDPIVQEIRNTQHERMFYYNMPVVPFLQGGDVTFELLRKLTSLSPTQTAIINNIREFVFGGQFAVTRKKVKAFARFGDEQHEDVDIAEFEELTTWLMSWIDPQYFLSTLEEIYDNWARYGNAYIEIVTTEVAGEKKVSVYNHDADRCLYLATLPGMDKIMLISPYWYHHTNYGEVPDAVPLYPNWKEEEDGTKRTILHLKHKVSGREWYGEPYWLSDLYFAYNEVQIGQYNTEGYDGDFTGRVFFETFEGFSNADGNVVPPQNPVLDSKGVYATGSTGFFQNVLRFFTRLGPFKRSVLHRNAAEGSTPTKVHQFKPNTNHQYHVAMAALDESQIIKVHNWHPTLLGVSVPGKLGNTASADFKTALQAKFPTVIKPRQNKIMDVANQVAQIVAEFLEDEGTEILSRLSLGLEPLFKGVLESPFGDTKVVEQPEKDPEEDVEIDEEKTEPNEEE